MNSPSNRRKIALFVTIALSAAMSLSTLHLGWLDDDYIHRTIVDGGYDEDAGYTDLYCFLGGPEQVSSERYPMWWSHPKTSHCSFRPLAGLSLTLDHLLFARTPWAAHLHSILLCAVFAYAVFAVTRALYGLGAATFALLCVGLGKWMFEPAGWVAARHSSLAAALGGIAVVGFLTGEQTVRRRVWAWAALVASLLASEGSIGVIAILIVYPLVSGHGISPLRDRLREAAPKAALGLVYVGCYFGMGYGAKANAAYSSFDAGVAETLLQISLRLVAIVGEWTFGVASSAVETPDERLFPLAAGCLALLMLAALVRVAWPALDAEARRTGVALALAGLAALAPGLLSPASGRLLPISVLALMPALAAVVCGAYRATRAGLSRGGRVLAYGALGAVSFGLLVANPLHRIQVQDWAFERALAQVEVSESSTSVCPDTADVVVLSSRDLFSSLFGPYLFLPEGDGRRGHFILTAADTKLEIARISDEALRISATDGGSVLGGFMVRIRRPDSAPLAVGDRIPLGRLELEVSRVSPDGVSEIRVRDPRGFADDAVCMVFNDVDPRTRTLRFDRVGALRVGERRTVAFLEDPFLWF